MAASPSHKFGQIIGDMLEELLHPILDKFCKERGLYLDTKGNRPGVRRGKKVTWTDIYRNDHDLDFVIERGGTKEHRGRPVAFIEAAWRRYTKHSRNKAQEIQGALLPIADRYELDRPFLGTVLAGEFTDGSREQLRSVGFHVLYFSYDRVMAAFESVDIDARFDEQTPDAEFSRCVRRIESRSEEVLRGVKKYIREHCKEQIDDFLCALSTVLDSRIERVTVVSLFGETVQHDCVKTAGAFIAGHDEISHSGGFRNYEVTITYSNGDTISRPFHDKAEANAFLQEMGAASQAVGVGADPATI